MIAAHRSQWKRTQNQNADMCAIITVLKSRQRALDGCLTECFVMDLEG